jgi:hypothetical protein
VPTKFSAPISASVLAATCSVKPYSMACGMKCVLTIPTLVNPQTKKLPASSQKSPVRIAVPSGVDRMVDARAAADAVAAPYGSRPTLDGRSRMTNSAIGSMSPSSATIKSSAARQSMATVRFISSGMKIN